RQLLLASTALRPASWPLSGWNRKPGTFMSSGHVASLRPNRMRQIRRAFWTLSDYALWRRSSGERAGAQSWAGRLAQDGETTGRGFSRDRGFRAGVGEHALTC